MRTKREGREFIWSVNLAFIQQVLLLSTEFSACSSLIAYAFPILNPLNAMLPRVIPMQESVHLAFDWPMLPNDDSTPCHHSLSISISLSNLNGPCARTIIHSFHRFCSRGPFPFVLVFLGMLIRC